MQFLLLTTPLAFVLALAAFLLGPVRGLPFLLASLPFGAGAAFNLPALGNASVLISSFTAAAYLAGCLIRVEFLTVFRHTIELGRTGFWLSMLALVSLGITVLNPRIFAGATSVFSIARAPGEQQMIQHIPLTPSTANITQGLYFLESILVFLAIRAILRPQHVGVVRRGMWIVTYLHLSLALFDVASYAVGMPHVMEWIQTANYSILSEGSIVGIKRIVAGFSEASSCGGFTLGLLGYWLGYWRAEGCESHGFTILSLLTVLMFSTSTSAYAGFVLLCLAGVLFWTWRALQRRLNSRDLVLISTAGMLAFAVIGSIVLFSMISPELYEFLDRVVFSKATSASGIERAAWNESAFTTFQETWLLGAGLGSVRGSSFLFSTLGTIGLPGLLLYFAFFISLVADANRRFQTHHRELDAVRAGAFTGCLAILLNYLTVSSSPDMGLQFMIFAGLVGLSVKQTDKSSIPNSVHSSSSSQREWRAVQS